MPRRSTQSRLPFNSPEAGAPAAIAAHGNRRLTRSAAKVLRETQSNVLSLTPKEKLETKTNLLSKSGTLLNCSNEQHSAGSIQQQNAGILREVQNGSTPTSEVSTPPRKQVLFADEVSFDKDKENGVPARLRTPFRPQPHITLYSPMTNEEEEKEDNENVESDDSSHRDEAFPPRATTSLLMLTSVPRETTNDDDSNSLQVVVSVDGMEEDYSKDWNALDSSLSFLEDDDLVSENIEILHTNLKEDIHSMEEPVLPLVEDAAMETGHFVETTRTDKVRASVCLEGGRNEDEFVDKHASWQVWTIGFALLLFTAPFLLASDPVSKQPSIGHGQGLPEKTQQLTWVAPKYAVNDLDDQEKTRSLWNMQHFPFVPWEASAYAVGDDKTTEQRATSSTTTTTVSQTIQISTTWTTTVPIHGSPSRSAVPIGAQHPTTDLEDRYLLLVEKLATKPYMAKDVHYSGRSAEPRNLAQRILEKIHQVTLY
eukprot:scaffold2028_cov191-Amphora_coffeaeformis.AAC.6